MLAQYWVVTAEAQCACAGDHFLGLQGHPEVTDDWMFRDLKERLDTSALPKDVAQAALKVCLEPTLTLPVKSGVPLDTSCIVKLHWRAWVTASGMWVSAWVWRQSRWLWVSSVKHRNWQLCECAPCHAEK